MRRSMIKTFVRINLVTHSLINLWMLSAFINTCICVHLFNGYFLYGNLYLLRPIKTSLLLCIHWLFFLSHKIRHIATRKLKFSDSCYPCTSSSCPPTIQNWERVLKNGSLWPQSYAVVFFVNFLVYSLQFPLKKIKTSIDERRIRRFCCAYKKSFKIGPESHIFPIVDEFTKFLLLKNR